MTLTLWRGEQLLGELRKRPPSPTERVRTDRPPMLSAFLIPSEQNAALEGVWQFQMPFPVTRIEQRPTEPDIVAERGKRTASSRPNPGYVALEPVSPEQIVSVPREKQLTIRDEHGQRWLPQQIVVRESRFGPEHIEFARREVPPEAILDGSIWCVSVSFASDLDAPDDARTLTAR